jgi:hypothetical protein
MPLPENSDANTQNVWNFENSSQVPNGNWDCCAYGDPDGTPIFVAGSNVNLFITSLIDSQKAIYSYNGIDWNLTTSFSRITSNKVNFKSITYGTFDNIVGYEGQNKGVFTAVTSSSIFHSFNGIDWMESFCVPKDYNSVAYGMYNGKGTFVAVANSGEISFSRNGTSYSYLGGPVDNGRHFNSVVYGTDSDGNGLFVSVGNSGIIRSYSGGADWTSSSASTNQTWSSVTYAGGYFIALAGLISGNTFRTVRSKDGITWVKHQINNGGYGYGDGADMSRIWKNIVSFGGYVMALSSNTGSGPQVIISDDYGLHWSTSTVSLSNPNDTIYGGIAVGNNMVVLTGNNNSAAYATNVLPRANPILSGFNFGIPKRLNDNPPILYLDQFKPQSTSSASFMYSSSNPAVASITNEGNGEQINFLTKGTTTIRATQRHLGTILNSGEISATLEIRAPATISQSLRPDGVLDFGMAEGLDANYTWNKGVYGNPNGQDRFVFMGNSNKIMLSPDGVNWALSSQVIRDAFGGIRPNAHNFRSVTYGTFNGVGRFCAVSSHGQYVSEDGITFNACDGNTSAASTASNAVAYGIVNGIPKAVAVGAIFDAGYSFVLVSEDGLGWERRAYIQPRIMTSWNSVTFGYVNGVGTFLAVGSSGTTTNVMISTDGEIWTLVNTGLIVNLLTVAYGNGIFVALYAGGGCRSVDGVNWIRTDIVGTGDLWRHIEYIGGYFIAVASSIGDINNPSNKRVAISNDNGQTWGTPYELNETSLISYYALAAGNNKVVITGNQVNIENRTRYLTGIYPKTYPTIAPWSIEDQPIIPEYYPSGLFAGYKNLNLADYIPQSNSLGGWTFVSSDSSVAEVIGNTLVIKKLGTITLTADQASYSNFSAATLRTTFGIKNQVTLSNFSVPNKTVLDNLGQQFLINAPSFSPPASNPNNTFTYTSSNPSVVVIDGNNYKIMGRGSATITARQASTNLYVSKSISATITVDGVKPMITNFKIPRKTMDDVQTVIPLPTSNNSNPFTYSSSNTAVADVNGTTLTIKGIGSTEITAFQQGTSYFNDAFIKATFYVAAAGFSLIIDATDAISVESALVDTAINPPRVINLLAPIEITGTLSSTNSFSLYGSNVSIKKKSLGGN